MSQHLEGCYFFGIKCNNFTNLVPMFTAKIINTTHVQIIVIKFTAQNLCVQIQIVI